MLDFDRYLVRHGESGVQAILEKWETYQDIRVEVEVPLEARWNMFVGQDNQPIASRLAQAA